MVFNRGQAGGTGTLPQRGRRIRRSAGGQESGKDRGGFWGGGRGWEEGGRKYPIATLSMSRQMESRAHRQLKGGLGGGREVWLAGWLLAGWQAGGLRLGRAKGRPGLDFWGWVASFGGRPYLLRTELPPFPFRGAPTNPIVESGPVVRKYVPW